MNRLEFKSALSADDTGAITGIAWPFGTPDRYGDIIRKGAFASAQMPIPLLFAHDPADPVGVWDEARETDAGLELKGRLLVADVQRAREVHALVKAGAVSGLSIGFSLKSATPRQGGGREITALTLVECSIVSIPAHPNAGISSFKSNNDALYVAEMLRAAAATLRR